MHNRATRSSIQLKPFKDTQVYLGYYYGKVRALADSTMLNGNSTGVFKGKKALPGGIYFIVSPAKTDIIRAIT